MISRRGDASSRDDATLDVCESLDNLAQHVPPERAEIVRDAEHETAVETLDI